MQSRNLDRAKPIEGAYLMGAGVVAPRNPDRPGRLVAAFATRTWPMDAVPRQQYEATTDDVREAGRLFRHHRDG